MHIYEKADNKRRFVLFKVDFCFDLPYKGNRSNSTTGGIPGLAYLVWEIPQDNLIDSHGKVLSYSIKLNLMTKALLCYLENHFHWQL
ncbi:MAG: hypothetical protein CMJ19_11370 [Phycisphaeraceae bacterium]|nr:hypothetical protein [Phycisphaeraceae bacterium]|tara:strand:- start:480 stop:740 length:261 start_codon:yes stop_codon:yes gene_type:complete